jgi:hypothetical protein
MIGKINFIREYLPITILIALSTIIGLYVLNDYGTSIDESFYIKYGMHSLENYSLVIQGKPKIDYGSGYLDLKGPAYFMGVTLFSQLARILLPDLTQLSSWHVADFITFQLSIFFIYVLARRFFDQWASFGTAILFGSQPLFWGHAFINSLDIPFLAFFTISLVLGFGFVDRGYQFPNLTDREQEKRLSFKSRWYQINSRTRNLIAVICLLLVLMAFSSVVLGESLNSSIEKLVTHLYNADPDELMGKLFNRVASQSSQVAVDSYILKAQALFRRAGWGIWFFFLFVLSVLIYRNLTIVRYWQRSEISRFVLSFFKCPLCILAGIVLGLTISMRVLAPYAFVLVAIYATYTLKERGPLWIAPYLACATIITYLTWPYLWGNPIQRYLESLTTMADFPWEGEVLFSGSLYPSNSLPWTYLPKLMLLQLTEPVVGLFWLGLILSAIFIFRHRKPELLFLILLWFLIPVTGIILLSGNLYDNFRHIFFLLPPVFLAAGMALEWVFSFLKPKIWRMLVLVILVFPALGAGIRLHPYQYIYYNTFTGGVSGAFRNYELDYWMTSFSEMALYLNEVAEPGAQLLVFGMSHLITDVLRADIQIYEPDSLLGVSPDYAIVSSRKNDDLLGCRGAPILYSVEREGAILGVIKAPDAPGQCP